MFDTFLILFTQLITSGTMKTVIHSYYSRIDNKNITSLLSISDGCVSLCTSRTDKFVETQLEYADSSSSTIVEGEANEF